ncbi:hypothetical protein HDV02_004634 [Globomyces sp. JEL0801]|nr:hypothetical protein HDV02_004634 [Globomyces sp. JEL0801]
MLLLHETPVSVKKLGHTSGLSLSRWIKLLGESESSPVTSAKPVEEDGQIEKEEVDDSFTDEMKDDMLAEWGSPLDECGSVWKRLILNQQNVGQVELQLSYFPTFPEVESTAISQMAKKSVCGILAITIHQAKELSTGKASAVTCDVYSGDDLVFSTPPKKRTANPTWEHKHLVYCEDVNLLEYRLALNNRNEALGECLIPVKRALQGDDDWYKIFKTKSGNGGGGKLRVGFKFIPIDLYHSSVDLDKAWWNDPIGFLRVNVKEAKGLTNVELVGYSDPYCKFFIAGRAVGVTHHKENTLNPIWNETFYTIAYSTKEELNFDVFDWNNLQKDKLLGKVTLPLGTLMSYYDKARKSLDQDRIGKIEQDGFEVTLKGERTLSIDVVEDDGEVVTDQFSKSILGRGAQITSKVKKGLKHTFAAEKKVKQKGSIHFELDFFGVVVPDCIIANNEFANTFFDDLEGIEPPKSAKSNPRSPMDLPAPVSIEEKSSAIPVPSSNPTVEKQSSTSNLKQESTEKPQLDQLIIQQDQKPADPILELTLEESIKQILNKHDSGILRIGLTGGEFNRKVKPYLIVYANGEEFYKSHTVPISSTTPYWHTSKNYSLIVGVDKFISKFKETVFEMQIRDQLDDEPNDRDPYLGMWKGDFIQELLGKGHFKVPFKQYTVDDISIGALPQVSTVTMSFGFMPVKLDIDMSEKTNMGMLVLDIISAKDLPAADSNGFSDPYCIVSLNGKVLHKTKIHKKTLNPEFNERFEIPIMTKFRSTINIQIMDFNNVQKHEELGHCEIPLAKIVIEEPIFQSLSLDKANKGSLDVGFIFYPQVLDKKWSNLDANDSKLKTETTGLGKFSRGVTSGISDLLGGSRKRSNSKFSNTIGMSQQGSLESISEKAKTTASILPNHLQRPPSTAFDNFTSPSRKSSAESISSYPALTLEDGHSLAGSESRESLALEQRKNHLHLSLGCNVKILGARNLKSVDSGGTSDPYIKVYKSGGKHSLHKTHVIKKNLNPTWDNEVFDANYTDILQFNIFDKNVIQSDVPLGHVEVNLGTLFQSTDTIDSWFSVQGGEGEIHISATTNYNPALKKKTKKSILSLGKRQE